MTDKLAVGSRKSFLRKVLWSALDWLVRVCNSLYRNSLARVILPGTRSVHELVEEERGKLLERRLGGRMDRLDYHKVFVFLSPF